MQSDEVKTISRGSVSGRLSRGVGALALSAALAVFAAACNDPSPTATAAQNLELGVAAQEAGNYATATTDYNKVLAAEPENVAALFDLGDVEQFEHLNSAAESHYRAALAVDPNYVPAMYNLATMEATSSPVDAEVLYQQVIRLSPNDADAHFNLGFVLISLGEKAQGAAQLAIAEKLDPSLKSRVPSATTTTTTIPKKTHTHVTTTTQA